MSYAELVKRLRSCAFTGVSNQQVVYVDKSALEQAADCIEALERDAKAHEKEIAVWSENYAAMERKLEAARADTKKAVQAAYEEGFLAGTADGWVNNPRIKAEWKRSKARATLAEIEGEK
jgi:hypothetical protein